MKGKLIVLLSFLTLQSAHAGLYFDKLSSTEQTQVLSDNKQIVKLQEISGKPWPQITTYQWASDAPEEICAVFSDFSIQKDFVGDMLKSEGRKVTTNTYDVDYVIHVPVVSNESYTVRDVFSTYDNGNAFKISWTLLTATRTKSSSGFFACEPVSGGTLITYQNLVDPGLSSWIAGSLYSKALETVKGTPYTFLKQLKKEKTMGRTQLDKQISFLRGTVLK